MSVVLHFIFIFTTLGGLKAHAFEVPRLTGPVMDLANMIESGDETALDSAIRRANTSGAIQLQILTVESLQDEPIEDASFQIVKAWKLGREKNDNGVLFIVSKADRRMRIEVGQGLEGSIPDIYAKRIISDVVIPYFREARTSDGIVAGTSEILKLATGEQQLREPPARVKKRGSAEFYLNLLIFAVVILVAVLKPRRRGLLGAASMGGLGGWGGGRGGFGGGGGGWSGGGGGFSGGGASGGW